MPRELCFNTGQVINLCIQHHCTCAEALKAVVDQATDQATTVRTELRTLTLSMEIHSTCSFEPFKQCFIGMECHGLPGSHVL